MSQPVSIETEEVASRAREAVERALARNVPGLSLPEELDLEIGTTPKDLIHSKGTLKLYHYRPTCEEIYRVPVLLVMSLVSKAYIFDLTEGQSLVEFLRDRGFDVYLIDWGVPRAEHSKLGLADYVTDFIPECIEKIGEDCGVDEVTLIGYCMGGSLAAMYAALHPDGPLRNLVCVATPVNSDGMPMQRLWASPEHFDIDRLVDELGNVPSELVVASLEMLTPLQRTGGRVRLLQNASDDAFVRAHLRMERWANDQIPFPGETARQMTKDFLLANKLVKGEFEINGQRVDLGEIRVPLLHVTALHDRTVPPDSSRDLVRMVGSEDKTEIVMKGGHVSLVAGGNAVYRMWPKLDQWMSERSV